MAATTFTNGFGRTRLPSGGAQFNSEYNYIQIKLFKHIERPMIFKTFVSEELSINLPAGAGTPNGRWMRENKVKIDNQKLNPTTNKTPIDYEVTEGNNPDPVTYTRTEVTKTVKQYGTYIAYTDLAEKRVAQEYGKFSQNSIDQLNDWYNMMVEVLVQQALSLDSAGTGDKNNTITTSQIFYPSSTETTTASLTVANSGIKYKQYDDMYYYLEGQRAGKLYDEINAGDGVGTNPVGGAYALLVGYEWVRYMLSSANTEKTTFNPVRTFQYGTNTQQRMLEWGWIEPGFRVFVTPFEIYKRSSGGVDVSWACALGMDALAGLSIENENRELEMKRGADSGDALNLTQTDGIKMSLAFSLVNSKHVAFAPYAYATSTRIARRDLYSA